MTQPKGGESFFTAETFFAPLGADISKIWNEKHAPKQLRWGNALQPGNAAIRPGAGQTHIVAII